MNPLDVQTLSSANSTSTPRLTPWSARLGDSTELKTTLPLGPWETMRRLKDALDRGGFRIISEHVVPETGTVVIASHRAVTELAQSCMPYMTDLFTCILEVNPHPQGCDVVVEDPIPVIARAGCVVLQPLAIRLKGELGAVLARLKNSKGLTQIGRQG